LTYKNVYDKVNKVKGGLMATKITTKKPLFGNNRSHALNATRRKQNPNLQSVTLENGIKVRLSARELRTLNKVSDK
jgi:large subunit ribosomal protein L28